MSDVCSQVTGVEKMLHNRSFKKRKIKAVILGGSRDFGRYPVASRFPTALWPVVDKSAIERLLAHLCSYGITQIVVCSNGDGSLLQKSIDIGNYPNVEFLDEKLPSGTAGCLRDAAGDDKDALLLVLPGSIVQPPDMNVLLHAHRRGRADLTVAFNRLPEHGQFEADQAGIYVCEPDVLQYVPEAGYYDIKESLIPAMLSDGKSAYAMKLPAPAGNFRNCEEYLYSLSGFLRAAGKDSFDLPVFKRTGLHTLWMADDVEVDSSARFFGPVILMKGAAISQEAVIFGPTVIGRNAKIGRGSLVVNSVLWDDAQIGRNCEVQKCLLDKEAVIQSNTIVDGEAVVCQPRTVLRSVIAKGADFASSKASKLQKYVTGCIESLSKITHLPVSNKNVTMWLAGAILSAAFIWSYWSGIIDLWGIWQRSDEYSSGLLVPFLAVYVLWARRRELAECDIRPSAWGLFAFIAVQAFRGFGLFFMYGSAERLSIVGSIAALVLFLFGWQVFRKMFTIFLFLGLMLPLPKSVHTAVMLPLQDWATSSAVFCLEMLGYAVVREGNIIHINSTSVAVAEACNGLRMVTAFFVIIGLVALLVRRTWWEKLVILISGLPIALLCNTVRLTITAVAFTVIKGEYWEKAFHDFGGYAMMPLALAAVIFELWLLTKLVSAPEGMPKEIIVRKSGS